MTNLDVAVTLRLRNQFGSGAQAAARDLNKIQEAAQRLGRTRVGARIVEDLRRLRGFADAAAERLERIGRIAAGVGAGFYAMRRALGAPVEAAADFEDVLVDIAQMGNLSREQMKGLGAEAKAMAEKYRSAPLAIAQGMRTLISSGIEDIAIIKRLAGPIQMVARTYRAETADIAKAVFSMINNLKIAPDQVEVALGRMAQAAADGRFEIENFAQAMPMLAATMQSLNQTGLPAMSRLAALLETVSGSVGDPATASTAVGDLLQKITSPDVTKNLLKKGIDIRKLVNDAGKTGKDINEVIYASLMKGTKGNTTLLRDFIGDKEAYMAALALIQNIEKYRELVDRYEKIKDTKKLDEDFALRTGGAGDMFRVLEDRWKAFQTAIGGTLNPALGPAAGMLSELLDVATKLAETFPRLTGSVVALGTALGGIIAAKTAIGVLKGISGAVGGAGAAGAGAGLAETAGAGAAGAAVATGAAKMGMLRFLGTRLVPALGAAALLYQTHKLMGSIDLTKDWTVKSRGQGAERMRDLTQEKQEIEDKIRKITTGSKSPDMAASLTYGLKIRLGEIEQELKAIEEQMRGLEYLNPRPNIDTSAIENAIGKINALKSAIGSVGPSLGGGSGGGTSGGVRGGRASPGERADAGGTRVQVTQHITGGASPTAVAARAQREQNRAVRAAQARALHDLGSWA